MDGIWDVQEVHTERKRPLVRPKGRWKDNIKMKEWNRGQECMELYFHSPNTSSYRGVQLSTGKTAL